MGSNPTGVVLCLPWRFIRSAMLTVGWWVVVAGEGEGGGGGGGGVGWWWWVGGVGGLGVGGGGAGECVVVWRERGVTGRGVRVVRVGKG